jgi:antitoxin (DNA-binding transcriptional repressor) of toxin-antitoxin stability system
MKTANIRQVRHDLSSVLAWVGMGQEVIILNRTLPVAKICPISRHEVQKKVRMPDFAARSETIFGSGKKAICNIVLDEREQSKW